MQAAAACRGLLHDAADGPSTTRSCSLREAQCAMRAQAQLPQLSLPAVPTPRSEWSSFTIRAVAGAPTEKADT